MDPNHPLIFLTFFCFLCSTSTAFNITKILDISGYKTFNGLLSDSGLAQKINARQTITVLAVKDDSIGDLSGKPKEVVARVLSTHVILDYYDVDKIKNLNNKSSILTTLYQTTGNADNQDGFLNVTKTDKGVMFGSAHKGAALTASLVGSVASQPYNISVLQISSIIQAPGVNAASPSQSAPAPESSETPSESPADAPSSAPEADSPLAFPPHPDSTASDEAPADAPTKSASSALHTSDVAAAMVVVAACIMCI